MAKCYQHDHKGFFVGEVDDHGGFLPSGAVYDAPEIVEGFIPRWNGSSWEQVETHKGKEGYLGGQPHTIKTYGPLPEGWSDTPPEPTAEELAERRKAEIKARLVEIDAASVRPLRAIAQNEAVQDDLNKLTRLDDEAAALRSELAALEAA